MSKEHSRRHVADLRGRLSFSLASKTSNPFYHTSSFLALTSSYWTNLSFTFSVKEKEPNPDTREPFQELHAMPSLFFTPFLGRPLGKHLLHLSVSEATFLLSSYNRKNHLASSTGRKHRDLLLLHQNTCFTSPSRKTPINRPGPPSRKTRKTPMNKPGSPSRMTRKPEQVLGHWSPFPLEKLIPRRQDSTP